ncbi:hypothetical protein HCN44_003126 [Aphidius gifuensis]|uniref:VLRF1 domain-containing protein n=1 Tax=Aphidius gifuensis TaxID=684658 RepID=A0A835CLI4_APHGI|nr:ankyrin repeat and zinc finger domain-containing protein 1-like [Aphidius gifuensis]KAF7987364.1 hypothetical protein HCN44_003126 [Aphidius gifuensis]
MDHRVFKLYNQRDFDKITKGIKVAKCMRTRSSNDSDTETTSNQLDDLTVSDSLSCSFCNTIFDDQIQQRLHYKLDWHRYNLKQRLRDFKSITEDEFAVLADKDDVSSLSGSESEVENNDNENGQQNETSSNNNNSIKLKKNEKKTRIITDNSDSSDNENDDLINEKKKLDALSLTASRHSKVFFENDDGDIFSIYRCLLHSKKDIPEINDDMITQALASGKNHIWTIIMLGGGHFAAAVFKDGNVIVHKTFHTYTVRAKQGSSQSQRDNRGAGYAKSAGASLRRYNEIQLIQHVQDIIELWTQHIESSSLILYRAVGPQNRTVLFGGKNPPIDKNDTRLRPLPFPTRRATFNEVKRVYDILTSVEIYGSAAEFTNSFPISPRQPARKKIQKIDLLDEITDKKIINNDNNNNCTFDICNKGKSSSSSSNQLTPDRLKSPRSNIDRAKARKSPIRPLPDIIARLAMSSESDINSIIDDNDDEDNVDDVKIDNSIVEESYNINLINELQEFENISPKKIAKQKRTRRQIKKKPKKINEPVNELLIKSKLKLWNACKIGNCKELTETWDELIIETRKNDNNNEQIVLINMFDIVKLLNECDDDGNTMLHLAAIDNNSEILWLLLEMGLNPCLRNKKCQTAYAASTNKETRNTFRRFMAVNPDKFDYGKSQIPAPLTEEIAQQEIERKKQQRKAKRDREKAKKKEFELKKLEEDSKQRFLNLSDREKRALAAEQRIRKQGGIVLTRCFQCASDMTGVVPFEYNSNRFCSMPCLKEHRLHNKFIL